MPDFFDLNNAHSLPIHFLSDTAYADMGVQLSLKRLDMVHPEVSGNKFFKLKYNLRQAKAAGFSKIITFGGAHSNHIAATAFAVKQMGLHAIGVIRGDELQQKRAQNAQAFVDAYPTLDFAQSQGMQFEFVSRANYRLKTSEAFISALTKKYGESYIVPEGGSNALAVKGCTEMLSAAELSQYDVIACAVGSGGTLAGLIQMVNTFNEQQTERSGCNNSTKFVLGVTAVKDTSLPKKIAALIEHIQPEKHNWHIVTGHTFGGFAKVNAELIAFINRFYDKHKIELEAIYTGKLMFALDSLIMAGYFAKGTRILALHTGGLQGNQAMQQRLAQKGFPQLKLE